MYTSFFYPVMKEKIAGLFAATMNGVGAARKVEKAIDDYKEGKAVSSYYKGLKKGNLR